MYGDDTTPEEAIAMVTCSYYMGIGPCSGGCYEEPVCQTNAPTRGWEHYLPESFDLEGYRRHAEKRREAVELERWLAAEKRWKERPVLEEMTETGVYPVNPASPFYLTGTRFAAHFRWENGSNVTSWHESETEAWNEIDGHVEFDARFWAQKEKWKNDGDRTTDDKYGTRPPKLSPFRDVLRIDGTHMTIGWMGVRDVGYTQGLGHGGRVFRWRWLDEPEGTVHESNNIWYQGKIPPEWRDRLPDNAVWLPHPCRRCGVAGGHAEDCAADPKNWGSILTEEGGS